jgi:catalase
VRLDLYIEKLVQKEFADSFIMPLSTNAEVLETSNGLVSTLRGMAGDTPHSFRPGMFFAFIVCILLTQPFQSYLSPRNTADIQSAHAKGHLLTGTFTPSSIASSLATAPHFNNDSTAITVRFSSSTGFPKIADTDPNANPRGIAVRFHLPPKEDGTRQHTDIVAHSTPYFPTRTGAEFLEFLKAATGQNAGEAVPEFLGRHPETARFLQAAKPSPESFATEKFFGVNAFRLVKGGNATVVRYRIVPVTGEKHLDTEALKEKSDTYLFDELTPRLQSGSIGFKLLAQVADEGDVTDNATEIWPEERKIVELGEIQIEKIKDDEESAKEQKSIIFDPIPRVEGVEPSDDPLLEVRASVYLISGKQRRAAEEPEKADSVVATDAAVAAT